MEVPKPPRRRRGISLAFKLIATTSALLAVALGAAALFNYRTISRLAEREAASRRRAGEDAMQRMSVLLAKNVATAAALPLAEGNFTYLDTLVAATVREDPRIRWMLIADAGSNRVVARTPGAPGGDTLDDAISQAVLASPADRPVAARDPLAEHRAVFGSKIVAGERTVGQLRLGLSTAELEAELARGIAEAHASAGEARRETLLVAAGILLLGIAVGGLQGLRIARPLRALSRQAHRIAGGHLEQRVDAHGRDEVGRLAQDFNFMADRLGALLVETASKASLESEMSLARSVQESMNPSRHMIEVGPFRVVGSCEPAHACGGDWWTLRQLPGERLLVVVGDVTGHGIPSAMIAASARGAVEALATVDDALLTPEQVLRAIDTAIRGVGAQQQLLMTCFAAVIDPAHATVEFSNAGHNFPYIIQTGAGGEAREIGVLALRGSPLGNIPGDFVLQSGRRQLAPGDVFVFFTDGVIDRVDGDGNRFGDRRLRNLLTGKRFGRRGEGLTAMRDDILAEVASFARGTPADDDITLVLCQYDPVRAARQSRGHATG
jgi:sigma-B regulation protein RsbU (phosphoserine phosphatase)